MSNYIFGQGTPWTYDQLQQKRQIAQQLMTNMGTPKNVGEGLNAIGDALLARGIEKRAAKEEERMRGEAEALWSQVSGGGMNAIVSALGNPIIANNPGQRMVLEQQMKRMFAPPVDPRDDRMKDIELQMAEAELFQVQSGAQQDPQVQSSDVLPDKSGVLITLKNGNVIVRSVTGEVLEGQAAIDFVRQSNENYTADQRGIYEARTEGGLDARIEKGADAAAAEQEGKQRPQLALEFMSDAQLVASNLTNINDAIRAIDEGAESGIVYNMLPNISVASASLQNAMDRMGLDVIGSVTFGALSEGEMRLAMETAVPRNLRPEQLKEWLLRKKDAQEKALDALNNAAYHFASGGTLEEHLAKRRGQEQQQPPAAGDDPLGLR